MRSFITTITNTYKAVRLLGDPTVSAYLQSQVTRKGGNQDKPATSKETSTFGTRSAFYHKHYIVQVL